MSFRNLMTSLDDAERERLFRYFTPEALQWSLRTRGLDVECRDEATLRAVAQIHLELAKSSPA